MGRVAWIALVCSTMTACAAAPVRVGEPPAPDRPEVYRPGWTAAIPEHAEEIQACVRGRQPPVLVVHVQALTRAQATGVTAVDGFGAVENCSARGRRVLFRRPASGGLGPQAFAGMPTFVLGGNRPVVPSGVLLEEIVRDQRVFGWLYWRSQSVDAEDPDVAMFD